MDVTLNSSATFPAGVEVGAYLASNWGLQDLPPSGAPKGASKAMATVGATGDIAFTGLVVNARYFAAGQVGGVWRYVAFQTTTTQPTAATVNTKLAELETALETAEAAIATSLAGKVAKPSEPPVYTQTYATATRIHAADALPTNIAVTLIGEVVTQLNATNSAVNELKKLVNGLIDDSQARGLAG